MKEETSLVTNVDGASTGLTAITVEVRDDQILAMEAIMIGEWQCKNSCTPSSLVQEALDMLIKTRILGVRLGGKTPAKTKKISD